MDKTPEEQPVVEPSVTTNPMPDPSVQPTMPTVSPPAPSPEQPKSRKLKNALSTLLILLIAPLLAIFITAFVFQSYQVDGRSMETTLQNNDRLIIWKVARTWARLTNHDYKPKRGDIIVFVKKGLFESDGSKEKQLIKRVIALPGERVIVKDGKITVYNKEHQDGFNPDTTLGYAKSIPGTTDGNVDLTVPAGEIFVCGDNRGDSLDSRYFGPIPEQDIIGKLAARLLPLSKAEKF